MIRRRVPLGLAISRRPEYGHFAPGGQIKLVDCVTHIVVAVGALPAGVLRPFTL